MRDVAVHEVDGNIYTSIRYGGLVWRCHFLPPINSQVEVYVTNGLEVPYVWHGFVPADTCPKSFTLGVII
jgi:hypothetical protein